MLLFLVLISTLAALGAAALSYLALRAATAPQAPPPPHPEVFARLAALERAVDDAPRTHRADFAAFRGELHQALAIHTQTLETRLGRFEQSQGGQLSDLRRETAEARKVADEVQRGELLRMAERITTLTKDNADRQDAMKAALTLSLETLRHGNEKKLDEMKGVVDEKLSATLNDRLDQSFKQVSDRLEAVHKGLGEMQSLATGVGDLKRVLTNVKTRGTWGEVQLQALLEDMLTPDQFERQARIRPDSAEVVDFAIRLPGQDEKGRVLLPIDCKYPQEDYERLVLAQEAGDPAVVETAGRALERALRIQAKSINDKYVHPPHSTNFAILYLPTEGLFAEVVRRAAFAQELSQTFRVTVAGPTTLSALLNSLRMGFTTLEIQRKSSEIGTVLGQTKTAFEKYGLALDAVDKALDGAKKKVADAGVRHREITRRLRGVETVALVEPAAALAAIAAPVEEAEDEQAA